MGAVYGKAGGLFRPTLGMINTYALHLDSNDLISHVFACMF
ncbi:Uncharacterized protein ChrSV_3133 [Chromobacterium vaccinii]|nr:Uncharacterized protein ChrSW_3133 [Chromobacterium vaccinii]QND90590.1 Uncharacterized protein ChrSV_3133 [Chromobacterium vaccinii]